MGAPAIAGRPLRILHCPWNVAGQSAQLAAAERALGADSRCVVIEETAAGFPADEALWRRGDGAIAREIARYRLVWRAIRGADVVHFSFGQSCLVPHAYPGLADLRLTSPIALARRAYARLVWMKDLPLLSALGKRIVVTWQGDDARQMDRSLALFETSIAHALGDAYYPPAYDAWKRRTIAAFDRYAGLHYALNPDLKHVLPARAVHLPYASFDPASVAPRYPDPDASRPLVFAHAPSHRGAKGTDHVLAAAAQLAAEGLQFHLELVEGLPRDAAIARYACADIVIDQLLAGWYGGLAVEAMALGKPVICYLREGDFQHADLALVGDLPIMNATTAVIAEVMRACIAMPRRELHARAVRSRRFVEKWHDPRRIAERTLADYRAIASRHMR